MSDGSITFEDDKSAASAAASATAREAAAAAAVAAAAAATAAKKKLEQEEEVTSRLKKTARDQKGGQVVAKDGEGRTFGFFAGCCLLGTSFFLKKNEVYL